jgi:hypothetical protein
MHDERIVKLRQHGNDISVLSALARRPQQCTDYQKRAKYRSKSSPVQKLIGEGGRGPVKLQAPH